MLTPLNQKAGFACGLRARIITQPTNRLQAPACARLRGRCRLRAGSGPTSRHSSAGGERTVSETPARFSLFCSLSSTADTAGSQPPIIPALSSRDLWRGKCLVCSSTAALGPVPGREISGVENVSLAAAQLPSSSLTDTMGNYTTLPAGITHCCHGFLQLIIFATATRNTLAGLQDPHDSQKGDPDRQ